MHDDNAATYDSTLDPHMPDFDPATWHNDLTERVEAGDDRITPTSEFRLTTIGDLMAEQRAAGADPNTYEFTQDALVGVAVKDNEILEHMRNGQKIRAITRLRQLGAYGLKQAKEAIEDPRVAEAALAPWVYIVKDIEGERLEVYLVEQDAFDRVNEINTKQGTGYAYYDNHKSLASGQRPVHPHNGI